MTRWDTAFLGDLCDIRIGRTPSRARRDYWEGNKPWLSISDMNQGRDLQSTRECISDSASAAMPFQVEVGTVVLSFKLSIGKVGIVQTPMYTNEAIAALPI